MGRQKNPDDDLEFFTDKQLRVLEVAKASEAYFKAAEIPQSKICEPGDDGDVVPDYTKIDLARLEAPLIQYYSQFHLEEIKRFLQSD